MVFCCDINFNNWLTFRNHYSSHFNRDGRYQCPFRLNDNDKNCTVNFTNISNFLRHIREQHTRDVRYTSESKNYELLPQRNNIIRVLPDEMPQLDDNDNDGNYLDPEEEDMDVDDIFERNNDIEMHNANELSLPSLINFSPNRPLLNSAQKFSIGLAKFKGI